MTTTSIYETIRAALNGGERLPENYKLPREPVAPNTISFMAGARDGIVVFHSSHRDAGNAVADILGDLRSGDTDHIATIIPDTGTLTIIDPLIDAIRERLLRVWTGVNHVFGRGRTGCFDSAGRDMLPQR